MNRISVTATIVLLWLIVALALDRLVLSHYCLQCANVLALELKLTLPATEITYPPVSLLVLIVVPMVGLAVILIPWRELHSGAAWQQAFSRWCQPWFWLGISFLLCVVGESWFLVIKDQLPKALAALADKLTITGTVSVAVEGYKETRPLALTASLVGATRISDRRLFLSNTRNEWDVFESEKRSVNSEVASRAEAHAGNGALQFFIS